MARTKRIHADSRRKAKLCLFCILCLCLVSELTSPSGKTKTFGLDHDNCIRCHSQSEGRAAEVVKIHLAGTHGKVGVNCADCHGGDPAQSMKSLAHSGKFMSRPDANMTLSMCGNCHQQQLTQFKSGRHFPERRGIPRIDCAECHGAHSIGNPPEGFVLVQYCAGCHGLEYLPALPQPFIDLLTLSDELRDAVNRRPLKDRKLSDEFINRRKEIRRLTAEIIHPTDRDGGLKRIPQILLEGEKLKQQTR